MHIKTITTEEIKNFKRQDEKVIEASVNTVNGVPRLYIDGKMTIPIMFWGNWNFNPDRSIVAKEFKMASKAGVNIFMTEVGFYIMKTNGLYYYKDIENCIDLMLNQDSNAKIIIRIPVSYRNAEIWDTLYTGEMVTFADGTNGENVSVFSDNWKKMAIDAIFALVTHFITNEKYQGSIIAYQFTVGEWFQESYKTKGIDMSPIANIKYREFLKEKYSTEKALREAWGDSSVSFEKVSIIPVPNNAGSYCDKTVLDTAQDQRHIDYYEMLNARIAELIASFSKACKTASGGRSLNGIYYGYTFELGNPQSGHCEMEKVLCDTNVDIISSPLTYYDRMEGGIAGYMSMIDSLSHHNKLWIMEDDIRTVSENVSTIAEPDAFYNKQLESFDTAIEIMKREFATAMVRSTGLYWCDLWGTGWFYDQKMWDTVEKMVATYNDYYKSRTAYQPEVAFVVDESGMDLMANPAQTGLSMFRRQRTAMYRSGISFGIYEAAEAISGKVDAKIFIFLNPWNFKKEEIELIHKNIYGKQKTAFWCGGFGIMSESDIEEMTGIKVRRIIDCNKIDPAMYIHTLLIKGIHPLIKELEPHKVTAFNDDCSNPYYIIDDNDATQLGIYDLSRECSFATKEFGGANSIVYGGISLSPELIRAVAKYAGANVFCNQNDVVHANDNFLSIYSSSEGEKSVSFEKSCDVYDFFEQKWYLNVNQLSFQTETATAKYFFYGKEQELKVLLNL